MWRNCALTMSCRWMGCAPKSIMYLRLTPVWLLKLERYMSSTSFFGKMSASLCAGGARETGDGEAMPARPDE